MVKVITNMKFIFLIYSLIINIDVSAAIDLTPNIFTIFGQHFTEEVPSGLK